MYFLCSKVHNCSHLINQVLEYDHTEKKNEKKTNKNEKKTVMYTNKKHKNKKHAC